MSKKTKATKFSEDFIRAYKLKNSSPNIDLYN